MPRLLYLIGEPGVGKSTVMKEALPEPLGVAPSPVWHTVYPGGIQLGRPREQFGGTDALAFNAKPIVLEWLRHWSGGGVVAEGDRLGNRKFFTALRDCGWSVDVWRCTAPEDVVEERRRKRRHILSPTWVRSRRSHVERVAQLENATELCLVSLESAVDALRAHPAVQEVAYGRTR